MKNINNMKVMKTNWCFKTLFVLLFVFGIVEVDFCEEQ